MNSRMPLGTDDEWRRLDPVLRPTAIVFPEPPARPADPFPGYTNIREITRNTYSATPRGRDDIVVLRIIPTRHFSDPRHQLRIDSNLDRAVYLREVGIATVHGRGTSADGRPFLARQHVSGVPIDVFNRGEAFAMPGPPSVNDVVRTWVAVCRAVHRAHLKGVLHGGLKFTNVLVDDQGQPHLVDFGLNLAPSHSATDDIVSLGRMLFDLLREQPLPPDPALTAIATRATSSDDRQSYANAGALADDLERFLVGKPLSIEVPGLASLIKPWMDRHVGSPSRVVMVGVFAGLMAGLLASAVCSAPSIATLANMRSTGVTLSNQFPRLWFLAVAAIWMTFGLAAERLGQARTAFGSMCCGSVAGLIAGFFAWASGAGGAIAAVINRSTLVEAGRLSSITNSSEQFVQQLAGPATSAAFAAGWLALLVPLTLGIGFGLLGAIASRYIRREFAPLPEKVFTFLEMTLSVQLGLSWLAFVTVGDAAGLVNANRVLFGPIALFAVAAICWLAIQHGVPALTRAASYLALFALVMRLIGNAMPIWVEGPVYLIAIGLLVVYVQSPQNRPMKLLD